MVMMSPYANSVRRNQGLGSIAELLQVQPRVPQEPSLAIKEQFPQVTADIRQEPIRLPMDFGPRRRPFMPSMGPTMSNDPAVNYNMGVPALSGLDEYKALRDYQTESRNRLQELQDALRGTQGYKDFRLNQLEDMYANRPQMGMGLGMVNPYGMQPYTNFGRPQFPQYPQPSYGYQQPNLYMRPQPQPSPYSSYYQQPQPNYGMSFRQPSYGGYQQPSGYGNYGQMPNPYAPQQQPSYQQGGNAYNGFGGGNMNSYSGYGQLQNSDMLF